LLLFQTWLVGMVFYGGSEFDSPVREQN
jgi:hypothetical protein